MDNMSSDSRLAIDALVRKIERHTCLCDDERAGINTLRFEFRAVDANEDLAREGDKPAHCCIVLSGWAYRYKIARNGSRQIVSFHVPGDMPDLKTLLVPELDHSIASLADGMVAYLPHGELRALLARVPSLAGVFWRDTLIDAAIDREWVLNLGQRDGKERIAHVLCETWVRLEALGYVRADNGVRTLDWPVTQRLLGEAVGMSTVHVNRSMQALRRDGLIKIGRRTISIPNWKSLLEISGFDPAYLSIISALDYHL